MKKIILVTSIALITNGCRYVHMKEPYLETEEKGKLEVSETLDQPNQVSTLNVPRAENQKEITAVPDSSPPDMPIRTRQSQNGLVKIENHNEFPVLIAREGVQDIWPTMESVDIENWTVKNSDSDSCAVTLHYNDSAARDRENAGMLKKLFTRENYYTDYTGEYSLNCRQVGKVTEVKFQKQDGSKATTFLADSVMSYLFDTLSGEKK